MEIVYKKLEDLKPYNNNPRFNDEAVKYVANSIKEFGFKVPMVIDKNGTIVAGHTRYKASLELGLKEVPCIIADDLNEEQIKAFRLADNKVSEKSEWNFELLDEELKDILELDMGDFGFEKEITNNIAQDYTEKTPSSLREKFIVPPFSVLDARNGDWQKRKKAWLKIIDSGRGRSDTLLGKGLMELANKGGGNTTLTGTSIFDPVLCEVLINWFSPKGGKIIDPFAGGSVRGIVSSYLQREYYGNDLSAEQIEENKEQFKNLENETDFFGEKLKTPVWTNGDSLEINNLITQKDFDLLLTCPPYADLEVYSDDPRDISNMSYEDFLDIYGKIIKQTSDKLKDNSFACIVVGEIRDENGIYRNFIGDTIKKAEEAGLKYYNEIILVTMCGTLPLRAGKIFDISRKIGNTHQKALVFYKQKDDKSFKEFIKSFETNKQLEPIKKSVLVFLKGNSKLAKSDIENYLFDIF
jgi:DNA modification methylase